VKLLYSGVCGSSWHQASDHWDAGKGRCPRPLIAGDEGVGIIVALNDDVGKFRLGDKGASEKEDMGRQRS
jgi:propanol-preferring alcohol dehydrogenase